MTELQAHTTTKAYTYTTTNTFKHIDCLATVFSSSCLFYCDLLYTMFSAIDFFSISLSLLLSPRLACVAGLSGFLLCTHAHALKQTHTQIHSLTLAHTRTNACTHAHTQTDTHNYTHTHKQTNTCA